MFDKYLIVEDSLRNYGTDGEVEGFEFEARLGYYRGIGLSMVEELSVAVDGEPAARDAVCFVYDGEEFTHDALETAYDRRWPFGKKATIRVIRPGGLAVGEHKLEFAHRLRVSYLPFPSISSDVKTLEIIA